jgi:hypothetical protein
MLQTVSKVISFEIVRGRFAFAHTEVLLQLSLARLFHDIISKASS